MALEICRGGSFDLGILYQLRNLLKCLPVQGNSINYLYLEKKLKIFFIIVSVQCPMGSVQWAAKNKIILVYK